MMNNLNDDFKKAKTPTLTLDPEINEYEDPFGLQNDWESTEIVVEDDISAGSVRESQLSEEERKQVNDIAQQIDVEDVEMMNAYGARAQSNISNFSTSLTSNVKTNEFGDIGVCLKQLTHAISSTHSVPKKGIMGFFQKGKQKAQYYISNYNTAETNIKKIEKDLRKHQQILIKDVMLFDQMYDKNLEYYKELTMYIIAGKKALYRAKNIQLVKLQEQAELTQDQIDIQKYNDYENACIRFEKRLADLESTRLVSIQMAPQIRLLQESNQEIVDRLRADIMTTIPLWRNQMVLALGIAHTRRALDAQSAVNKMTNEMFLRNAETLKQGAIDAAIASEKSVIDVETLRKVNSDIITSINEVVKIHEDGARKRIETQQELEKIEDELKEALLQVGKR